MASNSRMSFILALYFLTIAAPTFAIELPHAPVLLVSGHATEKVRPDTATLSLNVSAFHEQSEVAAQTVQRQLIKLLEILADNSVPDSAITSFNLNKEVERKNVDRVDTEIVGYFVSRRVSIKLDDISSFADLVAAIANLDNVSSLNANFDIKNRGHHEKRLMNRAGADARNKAEILLDGMSRRLGAVYAISESSFQSSYAEFRTSDRRAYARALNISSPYAGTVFQPSTIELRQTINVIFLLE